MPMFHFLRPEWLWGLVPLFWLLLLLTRRETTAQVWESVCDSHLLPHLLIGGKEVGRPIPLILIGLGWVVSVFALAGPVWSQLPQPVVRVESALVLVLDLSRSMDVQDIAPSRLIRAKHKILDILKARKEGQTALVVYAGESFVVSPLTDDANTMVTLVQSLETDLMPVQGNRSDLALRTAQELLEQVGQAGGDVLLLTNSEGDSATLHIIEELRSQGRHVSVLGVGTVDGAPIPETGGFMKDEDGAIVIPKLHIASLQAMARAGGGYYATVTWDDQDINRVLPSRLSSRAKESSTADQRTTDLWREEGPWLVLLLVALALPAFRRGWLGMILAFVLIPQVSQAFSWESLWFRPDQQGIRALERKAPEEAAALFQDPGWKGVANYRAGKYEEAVEAFSTVDTAEGHYNRGNALANLGRYKEALSAFQNVLTQQPHHVDAKHNLEIIEKLLQKQSSSQQEESGSEQSGSSSTKQDNVGEKAAGQKGASEHASDTAREQPGSGKEVLQKEKQAIPERETEPGSESSKRSKHTEKNQKNFEKHSPDNTQVPDALKADQSEQPVSFPSSTDEKAENQAGQTDVTPASSPEQTSKSEKSDQVLRQWLRRIPDDPGGLLRRKFLLEHQRRVESGTFVPSQGKRW